MNYISKDKQNGAVLIVALVILLVLTVLAVTNMRGVVLESRVTANRATTQKLQEQAEAALREAEFRFYGPANIRDKLEFVASNCTKSNKLNENKMNKPCLLKEIDAGDIESSRALLMDFVNEPIGFFKRNASYGGSYDSHTGSETASSAQNKVLAWMPYRGLDHNEGKYFVPEEGFNSYWNAYLLNSSANESEAVNPEYGAALEGKGTYYYLINGQANDELAVQSSIANVYVGLNN